MKSKLKRELQQFLEQERISLNSGIVNYITYQLADIKVNKEQLKQGFSFDHEETMEKIAFSIAAGLDFSQIKKYSTSLKFPKTSTYMANRYYSTMTLSLNTLFLILKTVSKH